MKYRHALWRAAVAIWMASVLMPGPSAAQELPYRLKWLFNSSAVGDIYADARGFFTARGLHVTVKAGGPERDAIKELELGLATFGVASADQVIRAAAKGAPVLVIAQLFQVNPLQWIYRTDLPVINNAHELRGRVIGITYGGNDETIMRSLLASAGLSDNDVKLFSVRYDYTPFYQGRVDIWPVYRNSQGLILEDHLKRAGETVRFFDPSAHGVKFVANSVVTSERMAVEEPDTVRRFLDALLSAWEASLDPARENDALVVLEKYDRETDRPMLTRQLAFTRSFVKPDPAVRIGTIDRAAWEQTENIMRQQGLIDQPVNVVSRLRDPHSP
ncbi:MAG: ABC transporter substrate-binding protein [Pseudomonadota bacterium]